MNTLERIKVLISSLPKNDIPLGQVFLQERDFSSLKELVDSAIYKMEKSLKSEDFEESDIDKIPDNLLELKSEIDMYITQFNLDENDCNFND